MSNDTEDYIGGLLTVGGFVDRGDPSSADFMKSDLTTDGSWHDLDLSSIVPAGATAVLFNLLLWDDAVASTVRLRKKGNVYTTQLSILATVNATNALYGQLIVPCDSNRFIEYGIDNATWIAIALTVQGWFL